MATVRFLPAARLEIIEARDWYAGHGAGLAEAFTAEVDRQVARMAATPLQFPTVLVDVRRALLRRFPYGLFFRLVDGEVFVLACFHASRNPMHWQERLKG